MRMVWIICALFALQCSATTWYVRPNVNTAWNGSFPAHPIPTAGVYGSQDGTSYANAWNGLESIAWGPTGVTNGDTLYVCGSHIYSMSNYNYNTFQAMIPVGSSGCTIRMDYAPDPGLMFGGAFDRFAVYPWQGPDANGVYFCTNFWGSPYGLWYEVDGTDITRLTTTNVTTWTGGLGYWARVANSNYVKTVSGAAPTTNIAVNAYGWKWELPVGLSNVTFQSCTFIGGCILTDTPTYPAGNVASNFCANGITFRNCTIRDCDAYEVSVQKMFTLNPGNDGWTFDSCDIGYAPSAIYPGLGYQYGTNQTRGIIGLTVTNCYIHDTDTANYPGTDGHAVGLQGNSHCRIVNNRIENTGCAVALFAYSQPMSNNVIANNFIKDVHVNSLTDGTAIWLSASVAGTTTSNFVCGNIIYQAGLNSANSGQGSGIASSFPDLLTVCNNTIVNCNNGIYIAVNGTAPQCIIENNIIVNPTNVFVRAGNPTGGTVMSDYNLCYTNAPLATPFYFAGGQAHDTHSVFANPAFTSGSPSAANDFKLSAGSPAIHAGTSVGLATDFAGNPFANPPSIGAFEFSDTSQFITLGIGKAIFGP